MKHALMMLCILLATGCASSPEQSAASKAHRDGYLQGREDADRERQRREQAEREREQQQRQLPTLPPMPQVPLGGLRL